MSDPNYVRVWLIQFIIAVLSAWDENFQDHDKDVQVFEAGLVLDRLTEDE
jgi:hypothetical protein